MERNPYHGQRVALATCHGKEAAIAPAFPALELVVPPGLDTDSLGTFTGEVPRPGSMRETARLKARVGMAATGLPLGLASEGSFGPHPAIPFLAAAHEMLIFIDDRLGIEIVEEQRAEATNFAALDLTADADLDAFLQRARFPSHALVFRSPEHTVKGIVSRAHLDRLIRDAEGQLRLETDMRAHLNPTRMGEIAKLARKLASRIACACPACGSPGFGVTSARRGLPCGACGAETQLVRTLISSCCRCGHETSGPRSDGRLTATPAECQECNP